MRLSSLLPFLASAVHALVLPQTVPDCASFADDVALGAYNATLLNTTYYPIGGLNNSNVLNTVSFCELYASISYGTGNDILVFALWLPDVLDYNNRFMAVGNGGMAGTIDHANMLTQLNSALGFAVSGGNAGHLASANNDGSGAPGVYLPTCTTTRKCAPGSTTPSASSRQPRRR